MSGHSAQSLHHKKIIDKDQLYTFNWILSHIRNIVVTIILILCIIYPDIRAGFGRSAIGKYTYFFYIIIYVYKLKYEYKHTHGCLFLFLCTYFYFSECIVLVILWSGCSTVFCFFLFFFFRFYSKKKCTQ
jgi:hypothetical protein